MNNPCVSIAKVKFAVITQAGAGSTTVVAAVVGKKIRALAFYLRQGAAGTLKFETATTNVALTGVMVTTTADLAIEGAFSPVGHFETIAGEGLGVVSGTGAVMGWVVYQEIG